MCVCVCTQAIAHVAQQLVTHWRKSAQGGRGVTGQEEQKEQWERGLLLPASWRHNRLVRQLQQCFINSVSATTSLSLPPSLSLLFSAVPFSLSLSPSVTVALAPLQLDCLRKLMLKKRFHLFENFLQFAILQAGFALFFLPCYLFFCSQRVA